MNLEKIVWCKKFFENLLETGNLLKAGNFSKKLSKLSKLLRIFESFASFSDTRMAAKKMDLKNVLILYESLSWKEQKKMIKDWNEWNRPKICLKTRNAWYSPLLNPYITQRIFELYFEIWFEVEWFTFIVESLSDVL